MTDEAVLLRAILLAGLLLAVAPLGVLVTLAGVLELHRLYVQRWRQTAARVEQSFCIKVARFASQVEAFLATKVRPTQIVAFTRLSQMLTADKAGHRRWN